MSVRVRVTAVAVAVTAVALAVGAWGMLRSIEQTQLGRIAAEAEERVDLIADRLAAGEPIDDVLIGGPGPGSFVQVIDARGDIVSASGGAVGEPFVLGPGEVAQAMGGGAVLTTSDNGATRLVRTLPGSAAAIPVDVRWERVVTEDGTVTVAAASPLEEVTRSLDAVRRSLWFGLPLLVALVGAVAWLVTGRALRPVEAMRLEAEAITHSTLHRRVPEPASTDEVGRLARTMNAMLDRLEGAAERQRRFVADASHELRTPVATLRAELEVAQRAGDESALRAGIAGALGEEQRLEDLLADLLLLASVEAQPPADGASAGEPGGEVDLGALVAAEAERPRRVPVRAGGTGTVTGSPRQLERVVRNLLDNAARHATTTVEVDVAGGTITVDDDGPGIDPADRARIFERFTRLDEGRARDAGGAGLGLSIVAAVVGAHGGTVEVGEAPGLGGARFTVRLPAARS